MECLRNFLNKKTKPEQIEFAISCGTTIGYLRKAISEDTELGVQISVSIEQQSNNEITREMLHPKNFLSKWPELAQQKKDKAA